MAQLKFDASKAASDQARTLAIAGIGIVWLFAGPFYTGDMTETPSSALQFAGGALALALALDLAQLVARTIALEANYQFKNRRSDPADPDPLVSDTRGVNVASGFLFYAKVTALSAGYAGIIVYFSRATF